MCVAGAGCARTPTSAAGPAPPSSFPHAPVVIISVDTLRSDHLPFYGGTGVDTPALSALAADSILFERAYASVPLTLPSHASLFTGLMPNSHGIHDNLGYRLKADVPTLAELLRKGGYRTGGAVSAFVLGATSGISRGFDFYEDGVEPTAASTAPALIQRSGGETAALLERWLDASEKPPENAPIFAFLHLYEPHSPYTPAEPFRARYAASPYDGEIATADAIVGEFLGHLKKTGLYDRSLIVFLSDHGESLGEHGEDEHGILLYRAVLQVPLLVKLPRSTRAGARVAAPVQLLDVFTTIGEATQTARFPHPEGTISLLALAAGAPAPARSLYAETYYPRLHFGWASLFSSIREEWHYVDAPTPELYDVRADPGESTNLAPDKSGPLREMVADLGKRRTAFEAPSTTGVTDAEDRKKLASLGYLSSGATAGNGPPADPKVEIGIVRVLRNALAAAHAGHPREALPLLERLLEKNPAMTDVWELYAETLLAAGEPAKALAAARKTVALSPPSATQPLLTVANLSLQGGLLDDAAKNAELAKERGDPAAFEILARIHLAKGDLASAESEAQEALHVPKVRRRALLVLARVDIERKNYSGALAHLDETRVPANAEPLPGVHYLRGDVLARQNLFDAAIPEFRAEIALSPMQTEAWIGLTFAEASRSRPTVARSTLAEMVRRVGSPEAYSRASRAYDFLGDHTAAAALRRKAHALFPGHPDFRPAESKPGTD